MCYLQRKRIAGNDFFAATGRATAFAAYERCQKELRTAQGPKANTPSSDSKRGKLDVASYQGRRCVIRRNLHIDRLTTPWLIKQFIDKRPRFYFVAEGEAMEGAIPFDMFGAEFTPHGEDCTFETMLKRFGLSENKGLREIAEGRARGRPAEAKTCTDTNDASLEARRLFGELDVSQRASR